MSEDERKMSEEEKKMNEGYLQKIKEWFTAQFERDLKEKYWKNIPFSEVVKDESEFGCCIRKALQKELQKEKQQVMNEDNIVEYADKLYVVLVAQEQQAKEEENAAQLVPFGKQSSNEYKGLVHEKLMSHIKWCYKQWESFICLKWHSPYLPIVQSSGYGKSRACKEIATSVIDKDWLTV